MAGEEVTLTQGWALKVSIHCEGCKRKVQKIISNIEGVERVDIDLKQHKVCFQGRVDPQTVIWKLEKAGKHAELWPQQEKPVSKENKKLNKVKDKGKDKQKNSPDKEDDGDQSGLENRKVESSPPESGAKHEAEDGEGRKAENARNKGPKMVNKPAVVEGGAGAAENGVTTVPDGSQSPSDVNGGKTIQGNGGNKKKQNKGHNTRKEMSEIIEVHSSEKDAAAGSEVPGSSNSNSGPANHGPPRHRRVLHPEHNDRCQGPDHGPPPDEFPPHRGGYYNDHGPPPDEFPPRRGGYYNYPLPPPRYHGPPVHAVNYHAAHPSRSYGASQYYAPQPPMNTYNGYMHPRHEEPRPYYDPYYQRPPESFQMFSDENPNACSLM